MAMVGMANARIFFKVTGFAYPFCFSMFPPFRNALRKSCKAFLLFLSFFVLFMEHHIPYSYCTVKAFMKNIYSTCFPCAILGMVFKKLMHKGDIHEKK